MNATIEKTLFFQIKYQIKNEQINENQFNGQVENICVRSQKLIEIKKLR